MSAAPPLAVSVNGGLLQPAERLGRRQVERLGDQVVLGGEVVGGERQRDTGLLRHRAVRELGKAVVAQDPKRGLEDRATGLGAV